MIQDHSEISLKIKSLSKTYRLYSNRLYRLIQLFFPMEEVLSGISRFKRYFI